MNKIWYYTVDGNQQGPVSAVELKQLATSGSLKPQDLVWKEGMPEWTPANNLKGLFPVGENKVPEQESTTESKSRSEESQGKQPFAGFVKASPKNKMKQEEHPEEEEATDEGNAFAGFNQEVRSQSKPNGEEEEIRPSRKSSRKNLEDDLEEEDEDDSDTSSSRKLAPHRGAIVLFLGGISSLSSIFCFGGPLSIGLGIATLLMGKKDLGAMRARKMDTSGEEITKLGFILGMVGIILGTMEIILLLVHVGSRYL